MADASEAERLAPLSVVIWILLAMCGTGMLAATTNQLCQEVAAIPLLWVWPLGLYLASYHQLNRMVTPLRDADARLPGVDAVQTALYAGGPALQIRSTETPN